MMRILYAINNSNDDERALINLDTKEIIFKGSNRREQMFDKIRTHVESMQYFGLPFDLEQMRMNPDHELYEVIGFIPKMEFKNDELVFTASAWGYPVNSYTQEQLDKMTRAC